MMNDTLKTLSPSPTRTTARRLCRAALACLAAVGIGLAGGCNNKQTLDTPVATEPGATFSGEAYLRGTVSSYGVLIDNTPLLVSGFGMVVDLNGTGSNEVPAFLREWLITEMRRNNVGSTRFGSDNLSPQRALADTGSAVVAVEGFVPPGAAVGSKFDLLVTMIDQNSTSLEGGRLFWPTTLTENGLNSQLMFIRPSAEAYGPMYINPVRGADPEIEFLRQAVVVNGGTVTEARQIQMVLNQRSYLRARQIADRVNERFPAGREDRVPTAVAKSDLIIEFNIPKRFAHDPESLLDLIAHLYLDPSPSFAPNQAAYLRDRLLEDPEGRARHIVSAWKTLGRNITPVLRELYAHDNMTVRTAALEAGAWLQDRQAVDPLVEMAAHDDPAMRVEVARWLVAFTGVPRARNTVRAMLNDDDPAIRIGAYEALSMVGDPNIERMAVGQGDQFKFYIDRVRCDKPMVFATQTDTPVLVIFGRDLGFRRSLFTQVGDALMIRTIPVDTIRAATAGLHEGETAYIPIHWQGRRELLEQELQTSLGVEADEPVYQVELGDRDGEVMKVRLRGQDVMDRMREDLLFELPRSHAVALDQPAAIAVVRLVEVPRRVNNQWQGEYVAELLALQPTDRPLPLAVRYSQPGVGEAQTYRIAPTVATLAYTLGYERDERLAKLGPDLPYSTVVQTLHQLCEQGLIPAPFEIQFNQIAQDVEDAQREGEIEERPEFDFVEEPAPGSQPGTEPGAEPQPDPAAQTPAEPPADERPE
jgi:hypothetical protein